MDLKSGYPFPLIKNGIPFDYPKLENNTQTEVLVIGGGISGALTAHALNNAGIECILIDARSVGLGSTCASTSLLQYEIDEPLHRLASRFGESDAVEVYSHCAGAIHRLHEICTHTGFRDFHYRQSIQLASLKKHNEALCKESAIRKKHGFESEYVDSETLRKTFGLSAPGALYTSLAAETDSYLLAHHLLQFDIRRGLRVFDRTKAIQVIRSKKYHTVLTEANRSIRCRFIIYANGYEALEHIKIKGVKLQSTYVTISESLSQPPPYWYNDVLIWNTGKPYLYMRTSSDRRIMIGGRDEPFIVPSKRDRLIDRKAGLLENDFHSLFPAVPFKREFAWTGVFASTADGLPYIGEFPRRRGEFFALGYGGNGITFGQVAADLLTNLISGKNARQLELYRFDR